MNGEANEILSIVSAACAMEKRKEQQSLNWRPVPGGGSWRESRYQAVLKQGFEADDVRRSSLRFNGNENDVLVGHRPPAGEVMSLYCSFV